MILSDSARAAPVRNGSRNGTFEIEQLIAEGEVVYIARKAMGLQVVNRTNRFMAVQVVLRSEEPEAVIAELRVDGLAVFRAFQCHSNVRLALGQAHEMRHRQQVDRNVRMRVLEARE